MLHTKIIDTEKAKIEISNAEKFIASSKFGASIFFTGTVNSQGIYHDMRFVGTVSVLIV